jgi:uncharacterized protein (TIGR00106 family)
MRVIADICVVPITGRISVRKEVAQAHAILKETGLKTNLHGYGTNIEGEWDEVFAALKRIHTELHADGVPRLSTTIRLGTRTDKTAGIEAKIAAVHSELD